MKIISEQEKRKKREQGKLRRELIAIKRLYKQFTPEDRGVISAKLYVLTGLSFDELIVLCDQVLEQLNRNLVVDVAAKLPERLETIIKMVRR